MSGREPAGRRRSVPGSEHPWHRSGVYLALSHRHERPDQRSDHLMQERIGHGRMEMRSPVRATVSRCRSLMVDRLASRMSAETPEIVLPLEIPGRPSHRSERETPGAMPDESARERVGREELRRSGTHTPETSRRSEHRIPSGASRASTTTTSGASTVFSAFWSRPGDDRGTRPERRDLATSVHARHRCVPATESLTCSRSTRSRCGRSSPSIVRIEGSRCFAQPRNPVPSYASVSFTTRSAMERSR